MGNTSLEKKAKDNYCEAKSHEGVITCPQFAFDHQSFLTCMERVVYLNRDNLSFLGSATVAPLPERYTSRVLENFVTRLTPFLQCISLLNELEFNCLMNLAVWYYSNINAAVINTWTILIYKEGGTLACREGASTLILVSTTILLHTRKWRDTLLRAGRGTF